LTLSVPSTFSRASASAPWDPDGAVYSTRVLVTVGELEGVAVDGDLSDDGMLKRLREHRRRLHVMPLPEPGELRAAIAELLDKPGHRGIRRVAGEGRAELHDNVVPELDAVGDPVQRLVSDRASMVTGAIVPVGGGAGD
jgi:hypothetical protein